MEDTDFGLTAPLRPARINSKPGASREERGCCSSDRKGSAPTRTDQLQTRDERRNRERRAATWIWIAARRAACAAEVGKEPDRIDDDTDGREGEEGRRRAINDGKI
nr:unnamed protein product [Digitaria exilis]